jgi:hypothetical protein
MAVVYTHGTPVPTTSAPNLLDIVIPRPVPFVMSTTDSDSIPTNPTECQSGAITTPTGRDTANDIPAVNAPSATASVYITANPVSFPLGHPIPTHAPATVRNTRAPACVPAPSVPHTNATRPTIGVHNVEPLPTSASAKTTHTIPTAPVSIAPVPIGLATSIDTLAPTIQDDISLFPLLPMLGTQTSPGPPTNATTIPTNVSYIDPSIGTHVSDASIPKPVPKYHIDRSVPSI